ncbi:hypothetical protein D9M71_301120 [compost metagenome]
MLGLVQHVQLIGRSADHLVTGVTGHFEEPRVDLDVAQITEPTNHRRCRIGREGFFKTLLGAGPIGDIVHDQHQRFRVATAVGQYQAAHAMDPGTRLVRRRRHFHQHIAERLAARDPADRVAVDGQPVLVAIAQGEAFGIRRGSGTQVADLRNTVHGQRRLVGPQDALVGIEQNNPVGQTGDDLLQLAAIGFRAQDVLAHRISTRMATLWRIRPPGLAIVQSNLVGASLLRAAV